MVRARSVADLLRARAQEQPDRTAYVFLEDGESAQTRLDYAQADARARTVAAGLREAGARTGDRAVLVLPPGLDYLTALLGCTYAGVVAVPAYPPDPFRLRLSLPRLTAIVADAGPVLALTTAPLLGLLEEVTRLSPPLGALRWLAVDTLPEDATDDGLAAVGPQNLALLQYTSGSTASPRGVMLTHANLLHNSALIRRLFRTGPDTRAMSWLPPYHDMGLIGGLLQPLYAGFPVTLMSPLHFLESPMRWLRAVHRLGVTASGGPNFAYDLCARRATPEDVEQLDLSSWQVAFNGAEPIRPDTLRRFAAVFGPAGFDARAFLPCYGLAEATLIVSGAGGIGPRPPDSSPGSSPDGGPVTVRLDRAALAGHLARPAGTGPAVELVACGRGGPDQRVVVVDPTTGTVLADGRVGEIWVAGPSVAQGYWRGGARTEQTFGARVTGLDDRFLRTGDLGFLQGGRLVVTGRLKDLLVVRGRNHYPQDIERTAEEADPALRPGCAAAFLVDDGVERRLVLVLETRRGHNVDVDRVTDRVRRAVAAEHGLRLDTVVLTAAGALPKTSSGKVQRSLCRAQLVAGRLQEVGRTEPAAAPGAGPEVTPDDVIAASPASRGPLLEAYLRARVTALTGATGLDRDRPLIASGLDSVCVVQLRHQVEEDLGVDLPLAAVFGGRTLAQLADLLGDEIGTPAAVGRRAARAGDGSDRADAVTAPLTHGQRYMWVIQRLEPESTAYTISTALGLPASVDRPALRRALDTVVSRHGALRTTFDVRDGEPVQVVGRGRYPELGEHDIAGHDVSGLDRAALAARLHRAAAEPFDLERGPLLRLDLFGRPGAEEVLLLAAHHLVADFWSMAVLAGELGRAYTAHLHGDDSLALRAPRAQFLDVARWQRTVLEDEVRAARLAGYWDEQMARGIPALELPAVPAGPGGARPVHLPADLVRQLRDRAATEGATLYVLLLAAFQAVLHSYTGQPELVIGSGVAGRTRPEFVDVVGCCTNTVVIRSSAPAGTSFRALLAAAAEQVVGALEHQDYPMPLLARRHRSTHRRHLYGAVFTFNRAPANGEDVAALLMVGPQGTRTALGALEVEPFVLPAGGSSLPVELVLAEAAGEVHGRLRYRAGALDDAAADLLVRRLVDLLAAVAVDPGLPVAGTTAP